MASSFSTKQIEDENEKEEQEQEQEQEQEDRDENEGRGARAGGTRTKDDMECCVRSTRLRRANIQCPGTSLANEDALRAKGPTTSQPRATPWENRPSRTKP